MPQDNFRLSKNKATVEEVCSRWATGGFDNTVHSICSCSFWTFRLRTLWLKQGPRVWGWSKNSSAHRSAQERPGDGLEPSHGASRPQCDGCLLAEQSGTGRQLESYERCQDDHEAEQHHRLWVSRKLQPAHARDRQAWLRAPKRISQPWVWPKSDKGSEDWRKLSSSLDVQDVLL